MIAARSVAITVGLLLCVSAGGQAQQPPSRYDPEGRRDPFASPIPARAAVVAPDRERAKGLAGVAIVDVVVTGLIRSGKSWFAIVAGPDGAMYLARTNDQLHDGVVRSIDRDAVVFLARGRDRVGDDVSSEVRKALRPVTGAGR